MSALGGMTWTEVRAGRLLLVPLGSCEQHGPHLPFDTDTRIAVALASSVAERLPEALVSPPIGIGASGEHQSFPGTLSIGSTALVDVLVELARSALPPLGSDLPQPFYGMVIVNGHGGNVEATATAAALLADEGRPVLVWHPQVAGGDSHAGHTETSVLLYLDPEAVRLDRIEAGSTVRWRDVRDVVVRDGLAAVSPNGVLGDPRGASAEEGERIVTALVEDLSNAVRSWRANLTVSGVEVDPSASGVGAQR
ncbi:MAG: mycofactocin biosynthesis peptidyl-dipeptidase MftE [Actinomycetota bacterium]